MNNDLTMLSRMMSAVPHSQALILDMLDRLFKGAGSLIVEFDREFRTFSSWRSKRLSHVDSIETAVARQWIESVQRRALGTDTANGSDSGRIVMDRWVFQNRYHCLGAYLTADDNAPHTAWCILLPMAQGAASDAQVTLLQQLVEPIQSIHNMSKCFLEVASHGVLTEILAEVSPWGIAVVDSKGAVRFMNAQARTILARLNGLELTTERVKLHRAAADRALQMLINAALSAPDTSEMGQTNVVSVPGSDNRIVYAIEVRPFAPMSEVLGQPCALLIITDLDQAKSVAGPVLAKVFSLSQRESQFAEVFGRGYRLQETAKLMQISPNTARVHLHHVLQKTGTQNQVELARVLSRLPYSNN